MLGKEVLYTFHMLSAPHFLYRDLNVFLCVCTCVCEPYYLSLKCLCILLCIYMYLYPQESDQRSAVQWNLSLLRTFWDPEFSATFCCNIEVFLFQR